MRRLHRAAAVAVLTAVGTAAAGGSALAYYALTSTPATASHAVAALTAPQSLTATPGLVGQEGVVDLAWTAPASPAGAEGLRYTVLRGDVPVCSGVVVPACRDTGLVPGTTYSWSVHALLGSWTGPAAAVTATVPVARALSVVAPPAAVAGEAFDVVLTATDQGAPDLSALGTRTLTVTGPSGVGVHAPTSSVTVEFLLQADGSVRATAPVTLVAAETTSLTLAEPDVPGRSGTSGEVVVAPQLGGAAFADCQGPPGYACGSRLRLDGVTVTGVVVRDVVDALGNALPLPADTMTLTLKNDRKGELTQVVVFDEGSATSLPWSFTPEAGAEGKTAVTATAPVGRTAPAPISLML